MDITFVANNPGAITAAASVGVPPGDLPKIIKRVIEHLDLTPVSIGQLAMDALVPDVLVESVLEAGRGLIADPVENHCEGRCRWRAHTEPVSLINTWMMRPIYAWMKRRESGGRS
jgi:hypothetical protein